MSKQTFTLKKEDWVINTEKTKGVFTFYMPVELASIPNIAISLKVESHFNADIKVEEYQSFNNGNIQSDIWSGNAENYYDDEFVTFGMYKLVLSMTTDGSVPVSDYLTKNILFEVTYDDFNSILLLQSNSENNRIVKFPKLNMFKNVVGTFRDIVSIIRPEFDVVLDEFPKVNYVYISKFNRYYYIDDITIVRTNVYHFKCRCDTLMSFYDTVLNQDVIVTRQEYDFNNKIVDDSILSLMECSYDYRVASGFDKLGFAAMSFNLGNISYVVKLLSTNGYNGFSGPCIDNIICDFSSMQYLVDYILTANVFKGLTYMFNDVSNAIVDISVYPFQFDKLHNFKLTKVTGINACGVDLFQQESFDKTHYTYYSITKSINYDNLQTYPYILGGIINLGFDVNNFLSYPPYTEYTLHIPFVGDVGFNPLGMKTSSIVLVYFIDADHNTSLAMLFDKYYWDKYGKYETPFGDAFGIIIKYALATYSVDFAVEFSTTSSNASENARNRILGYIKAGAQIGAAIASYGASNAAIEASKAAKAAKKAMRTASDLRLASSFINTAGEVSVNTIASSAVKYEVYNNNKGAVSKWYECNLFICRISKYKYIRPDNYEHLLGVPSTFSGKLSKCRGFTKVGSVFLKNLPNATSEELIAIEDSLKEGVLCEDLEN